jgi:hypothetical protein
MRIIVNVGNLLEVLGAAVLCYAVDQLVGLAWALILAGILLIIGAEFVYDAHTWKIPLPHVKRMFRSRT